MSKKPSNFQNIPDPQQIKEKPEKLIKNKSPNSKKHREIKKPLLITSPIKMNSPSKSTKPPILFKKSNSSMERELELLKELKRQAIEKERLLKRRKKAAILIQKIYRGWTNRKKYILYKEKQYFEECKEYLYNKKIERIHKNANNILAKALKIYITKKRKDKSELYNKFLNHCARIIQIHFKNYLSRKQSEFDTSKQNKLETLLWTVVLAWKTRKILNLPQILDIKRQIKDMDKLNDELLQPESTVKMKYKSKYMQEDLSKSIKTTKMEFSRLINEFLENKDWPQQINIKVSARNRKKISSDSSRSPEQIPEEDFQTNLIYTNNSKSNNPYEIRENMPVGGKNQNTIDFESDNFKDETKRPGSSKHKNKKFAFLKRKNKFEENKEEKEEKINDPVIISDTIDKVEEEQNEFNNDEQIPKFTFLKKQNKRIVFKKLDWNKVQSRVDCWVIRDSPSKIRSFSNKQNDRTKKSNSKKRKTENSLSPKRKINLKKNRNKSPYLKKEKIIYENPPSLTNLSENSNTNKLIHVNLKPALRSKSEKKNISIEELEKAFENNYMTKLENVTDSLENLKNSRKIEKTKIPQLKTNSKFTLGYQPKIFLNMMKNLEDNYKFLQSN